MSEVDIRNIAFITVSTISRIPSFYKILLPDISYYKHPVSITIVFIVMHLLGLCEVLLWTKESIDYSDLFQLFNFCIIAVRQLSPSFEDHRRD